MLVARPQHEPNECCNLQVQYLSHNELLLHSSFQHPGCQDLDRADIDLGLTGVLHEEVVVDSTRENAGQRHGHHHEVHALCVVESH